MGAVVCSVEGRQENVDQIKLNYPDLIAICANLDTPNWTWGSWDVIINFGLHYHLTNFHQEHLSNCLLNSDLMFFETVIFDNNQPTIYYKNETGNDQALKINAGTPSTSYVENILISYKVDFKKYSDSKLNGNNHHYDWIDRKSNIHDGFARRFWIINKRLK